MSLSTTFAKFFLVVPWHRRRSLNTGVLQEVAHVKATVLHLKATKKHLGPQVKFSIEHEYYMYVYIYICRI